MDYFTDNDTREAIKSSESTKGSEYIENIKAQNQDAKEKQLFDAVSFTCSKLVTKSYSTSFSIGVWCLNSSIRNAIYSIYGFVRFADEIVDSFHNYNKDKLLDEFEQDYYEAMYEGISLNPILNSFVHTVKKYRITDDLVRAFLTSMRADLYKNEYNEQELEKYIYGSADVVGLMCLKVFVNGDDIKYEELKPSAKKLGSAFQKVNFLRDLKDDQQILNRTYFPQLKDQKLNNKTKKAIVEDIYSDYREALKGIRKLPLNAKLGVFIAYTYYLGLTKKIEKASPSELLKKRFRISKMGKITLLSKALLYYKMGLV